MTNVANWRDFLEDEIESGTASPGNTEKLRSVFVLKTEKKATKMSAEFSGGRGRGTKRKVEQNATNGSKKLRGELQTPTLGPYG